MLDSTNSEEIWKDIPGVYIIKSLRCLKTYVGSSKAVRHRIEEHRWMLRNRKHYNPRLQNFVNKYGVGCLSFHLLEECLSTKEDLIALEQHYIDLLKPWFNLCPNADSPLGRKWSRRRRLKSVGRKLTEEHKRNISRGLRGRVHSPETIEKIRQTNKAVRTEEWKRKHPRKKGQGKGRKASLETRKRLCEIQQLRSRMGLNKWRAKVTKDQVVVIRNLVASGAKQRDVAKMFSISPQNVNGIVKRRQWRDVP